ncbi:MAG: hypothetical protein BGO55_06390 [Sphingobacteriales bacterium 50-39]|nr:hypothetical protein [Sphingobacteriales bacterium]OJW52889.1 MAG: hypothetical protein BGO55_06390 [Sphingobacteriales bacterium 50-39]
MKKVFILSLCIFLTSELFAQQTPADSIKQAINTLFDAMRTGDSSLFRSIFTRDMIKQRVSNDKNGKVILSTESADDLVKRIGAPHTAIAGLMFFR